MPAQAVAGHDGTQSRVPAADRAGLLLGHDHNLIVSSGSDAPICKVLPQDAAENDNAGPATTCLNKSRA